MMSWSSTLLLCLLLAVLAHASSSSPSSSSSRRENHSFQLEPLIPAWPNSPHQAKATARATRRQASNAFASNQIVSLALHVKQEQNASDSYHLVNASLVAFNLTTGAVNTIYGPVTSIVPPFGTAYDPFYLRYFFLDAEANFLWIDLPCSCMNPSRISEVDLLGRTVLGMQYDNVSSSLFTVSLNQRLGTVNKQPTDSTQEETTAKVPFVQNEFIPQTFPSASWGKNYAFTSLIIDSTNSSQNQVHLWTVDTSLVLQPSSKVLSPQCSYISMLAYDTEWDVLVGLVGLADAPDSLPSWVKVNATGKMDILPINTSYQLNNVFSYTYDSASHTFFYVSDELLCTVNLFNGSSTELQLAASLDNILYTGLNFQERPVPTFT